jgi:hypothetical protein
VKLSHTEQDSIQKGLVTVAEHGPGYLYACSCAATVGASPDVVKEACKAWAKDAGWQPRSLYGESRLVFKLYRETILARWSLWCPDLSVEVKANGNKTEVTFAHLVPSRKWSTLESAVNTCDRFARGVCAALASQGVLVVPRELATSYQNQAKLRNITKRRWRLKKVIVTADLASWIGAVVLLVVKNYAGLPVFGVAAFLYPVIALVDINRERSIGRTHQPVSLVGYSFSTLCGLFLMIGMILAWKHGQ